MAASLQIYGHYTDYFGFVNKKSCASTVLPATARHERASYADFINFEIPDPQPATFTLLNFSEKRSAANLTGAQPATRNPLLA
jgi:hypothetical protein